MYRQANYFNSKIEQNALSKMNLMLYICKKSEFIYQRNTFLIKSLLSSHVMRSSQFTSTTNSLYRSSLVLFGFRDFNKHSMQQQKNYVRSNLAPPFHGSLQKYMNDCIHIDKSNTCLKDTKAYVCV